MGSKYRVRNYLASSQNPAKSAGFWAYASEWREEPALQTRVRFTIEIPPGAQPCPCSHSHAALRFQVSMGLYRSLWWSPAHPAKVAR